MDRLDNLPTGSVVIGGNIFKSPDGDYYTGRNEAYYKINEPVLEPGNFLVGGEEGNEQRKPVVGDIEGLEGILSGKADKSELPTDADDIPAGAINKYVTQGELDKLAGLESSKYRGEFVSIEALETAIPVGEPGFYADVDSGAGHPVVRYIWDNTDGSWVLQSGEVAPLTASQVKVLYEENPNTNAFTDSEKAKLSGISPGATANATNAQLRDRATHTGVQAISTVSGLSAELDNKANDNAVVKLTGNQTVNGVKTFGSLPVLPNADPTADNQASRKKYVDDGLVVKANIARELIINSGGSYPAINIGANRAIRVTAENEQTYISGIASGADGVEVVVVNASTIPLVILHNSSSATEINRLSIPGNREVQLNTRSSIRLKYSGDSSRWEVISIMGTTYFSDVATDESGAVRLMGISEIGYGTPVETQEWEVERLDQSTEMSVIDLDDEYPGASLGFQVVCPLINKIYKKVTGGWGVISITAL